MPTKVAFLDIFPLNFLSWRLKYSFSNFSLASFKGTDKLFSLNLLLLIPDFRDSLMILEIFSWELGNFREDLFHRLNVFEINIKPLNERISDIPLLINYFWNQISESYNIKNLKE